MIDVLTRRGEVTWKDAGCDDRDRARSDTSIRQGTLRISGARYGGMYCNLSYSGGRGRRLMVQDCPRQK
jgi:hypothetical protein